MPDTYDKRCQLGASRRRFEDASALHSRQRWRGAVYMGGYAIECSLKSLICYEEKKNNFKETSVFIKKGLQGASLHDLARLFNNIPSLQRTINLDRTGSYKNAWKTITSTWINDELRYSDKLGDELESTNFIQAVKKWHEQILREQGE